MTGATHLTLSGTATPSAVRSQWLDRAGENVLSVTLRNMNAPADAALVGALFAHGQALVVVCHGANCGGATCAILAHATVTLAHVEATFDLAPCPRA